MRVLAHHSSASDRLYPWLLLSVTSLGVILTALHNGTLNVALPEVAQHFHATAVTASWILLSYMLFSTILILVFGRLADIYGHRNLYLTGFVGFTVVSFLIGFSPNVWVLIGLRALQAAGGALIISNTTALITDAFPERLLGTGLGINVLISSIGQLLGPSIGGWLAASFGWQWVFWFNVPVGVTGVIWGIVTLRPVPQRSHTEKVDLRGIAVVFLLLGGLILAFSEEGVLGWNSWPVILGFVLFCVFTPCFIWVEWHAKDPLIDFGLFRDRAYAMANLTAFLNSLARASVVLLIALFFQRSKSRTFNRTILAL
ncbi:MFS transporter [Effusibacillus dendaii]|uniref:Major facilitator superfamily (MFS) profile domain-containing protein n=1 Tax=Effusibacillus dendaii TaxID=2743772 RepID=A0A7I8DG59_9BACL|nr:MFS transporter [Effusibacillus dendaii]BCJ87560.1 hypothetical protein skT53_25450 [Effusibacillus dendaii]